MNNFIHKDTSTYDKLVLFGDMNNDIADEIFIEIDDFITLETIVVQHLKKFPSNTQARKNNWFGPVPSGFKEWKIGKTKFWTYIPVKD